ncbi:MAG TPA: arylsulfotransferase family protein [Gaiellaceae bacterium]|nr:arylsulfotransferase family protein [Gaiellaceae bacterium]
MREVTRRELLRAGALLAVGVPFARVAFAWAGTGENLQRFVSRPDLKPPKVTVLHASHGSAPGYVFTAPSSGPGQSGAMIFDDSGELVWFHPVLGKALTDFKVQTFRGKPVLTWWEGKDVDGVGDGEWVVLDTSYRQLARFTAARGLPGDLHEFTISPENTALVTSNELRPWNGRRVIGGVVQELTLPDARLLWEWRSLDHVAVEETEIKAQPGPRFDYFHINAIDVAPDGNLIVSARNTWTAYKIQRRTGRVLWRLGGKKSDFAFGAGAHFEWQHDVREHPGGLVSVFDNAAAPAEELQSRALLLRLDEAHRRVTLAHAYVHRPQRVLSHFFGSTQLLADRHVFVGWGGAPYMTEFGPDGTVVFDAALPHGGQSYRSFRFPWSGLPADRPALVVQAGAAYASWNGATEVASWQLLEDGRKTQVVPRAGFETKLLPGSATRTVAVAALDSGGASLGTSPTVSV